MLKKILALALAGAMVLGSISLTAFAAIPDDKISITGLTDGDKVTFYQVLEWNGTEAAEYAGWNLKAPFQNAGTALGYTDDPDPTAADYKSANTKLIAAMVGDPQGNPAVPMQLTSTIAGKLADLATSGGKTPVTVSSGKAELTIDGTNNTIGMYMAVIDPTDDDVVYNPVFVSADYIEGGTNTWAVTSAASYSNTAAAKKSTVEIDKEAEQKDGSKSYDQTWKSTRPGEIVSYTVKTTIPGYGDVYQQPKFDVTDKLTDLKLTAAPTVTVDGFTADDYTITYVNDPNTKAEGATGYTVSFKPASLKKVKVPTEVVIVYSAEVTTDAHLNVNLEKNEVWVEFSHDYQHEDDYIVKKDDTRHYTYTIDADILGGGSSEINKSASEIVKVGVDASGKPINQVTMKSQISASNTWQSPLENAEFKLYTAEACGDNDEYIKADGTKYVLKSTADGRIKIEGLDATNETSVYWLKETKAPTGFIAQTKPVKIEIIPTFETQTFTEYWNGSEWVDSDPTGTLKSDSYQVEILKSYTVKINGKDTATHTFINTSPKTITWDEPESTELPSSIINTQGVELPSTGGIGTTLFYAGGAVLVLLAGVLLVSKRRIA